MIEYFLLTILRDGKYETVTFSSETTKSPERFLIFDRALGYETHILFSKEINFEDYLDLKKQLKDNNINVRI